MRLLLWLFLGMASPAWALLPSNYVYPSATPEPLPTQIFPYPTIQYVEIFTTPTQTFTVTPTLTVTQTATTTPTGTATGTATNLVGQAGASIGAPGLIDCQPQGCTLTTGLSYSITGNIAPADTAAATCASSVVFVYK